ncbi:MAG: RagB/SusD family nutrient uptake outer membrane protein [Cyclobacteriaceae bacterium]
MNNKILATIMVIVFVITGCEDFLAEEPRGEITSVYAETPDGIESLVNSLYAYNRDIALNMMYTGAAGTDIWTMAVNQNTFRNMALYDDGRMRSSEENFFLWRALNVGVDRALFALESMERVDIPVDQKNILEGETRALMAFWRYLLIETYGAKDLSSGGAHFAENATRTVLLDGNQVSCDIFYSDILDNIDFAIDNLPNPEDVIYGKLNVGAAKAMKAKFLLGMSGYGSDLISAINSSWTEASVLAEARDLALSVINDYSYALEGDYEMLWDVNNQKNNEVIFAAQFTDNNLFNDIAFPSASRGNDLHYYWVTEMRLNVVTGEQNVPNSNQHTLWYGKKQSYVMPTLYYMESFGRYDKRLAGSFLDTWYRLDGDDPLGAPVTPTTSTDTVLYKSFFPMTQAEVDAYAARGVVACGINHIYNDGVTTYPTDESDTPIGAPTVNGTKGFHTFKKHLDTSREDARDRNGNKDFPFFRLAEMHLMAAECEVRLGQPANAVQHIDAIRVRARMTGFESELDVSSADMTMDFILDEYARETGGELWRWYLLKRTGTLLTRVPEKNPDYAAGGIAEVNDYHLFRPIPQSEMDAVGNPDQFVQNQGY